MDELFRLRGVGHSLKIEGGMFTQIAASCLLSDLLNQEGEVALKGLQALFQGGRGELFSGSEKVTGLVEYEGVAHCTAGQHHSINSGCEEHLLNSRGGEEVSRSKEGN